LTLTRRHMLLAAAALPVAGGATALPAFVRPAHAAEDLDEVKRNTEELKRTHAGGDAVLGSEKAPVTIIEYASMTCPHCAHFSTTTFPELKHRYIDTGKVRFIFRDFPLDALAAAGFMLAHCAGKDRYMAVVETLFAKQADWVVREPLPALRNIAKQFGFTEESFNACLANQKVLDEIQATRDHAVEKLNVNSTPTFFINGKRMVGDLSIEQMAKEIDPYVKEG